MKLSKKLLWNYLLWAIGSLILLIIFLLIRFYNLKSLPIFVDEAIYSQWAQVGFYDGSQRLLSLVDGKQPLFIWLITIAMNFISNPVVAGRFVSIATGIGTLVGIYFLTIELFKERKVGIFAAILYTLFPFSILFNRMALYESTVGMFFVWSIYLGVLLIRNAKSGIAFTLGISLGAGILTKSTGFLSIYLLPVTLLLFKGKKSIVLTKWLPYALLAALVALLSYSVLFLSKDFYMISEKNAIFIYHFKELIPYHAFENWGSNVILLVTWVVTFFTIPSSLILLLSFLGKQKKEKLFLFLWFVIPTIWLGLFGRLLSPRYIYPFSLTLIPLLSICLFELQRYVKNIVVYGCVLAICAGFLLFSDYKILTDLPHAPVPFVIIDQFANSAASGDGLKQIISFLQNEAQTKHILVITEGEYGSLTTTVVQMYFLNNTLVDRYVLTSIPKQLPKDVRIKAKSENVYVILNQTQKIPQWHMNLVMAHKKGSGNQYIRLYKVID